MQVSPGQHWSMRAPAHSVSFTRQHVWAAAVPPLQTMPSVSQHWSSVVQGAPAPWQQMSYRQPTLLSQQGAPLHPTPLFETHCAPLLLLDVVAPPAPPVDVVVFPEVDDDVVLPGAAPPVPADDVVLPPPDAPEPVVVPPVPAELHAARAAITASVTAAPHRHTLESIAIPSTR